MTTSTCTTGYIAFNAISNTNSISKLYKANFNGTDVTLLSTTILPKSPIAWSPDGNSLAFISLDSELCVVEVKTIKQNCFNNKLRVYDFSWSFDGQSLAYSASELNSPVNPIYTSIYIRALSSGESRKVTGSRDLARRSPRWSKDNQKLVFAAEGSEQELGVFLLDLSSSKEYRLTAPDYRNYAPEWQPS